MNATAARNLVEYAKRGGYYGIYVTSIDGGSCSGENCQNIAEVNLQIDGYGATGDHLCCMCAAEAIQSRVV